MDVVVRRYIDILTIIINFPYFTLLAFFLAAASLLLCSFKKYFFGLYIYAPRRIYRNFRGEYIFVGIALKHEI